MEKSVGLYCKFIFYIIYIWLVSIKLLITQFLIKKAPIPGAFFVINAY